MRPLILPPILVAVLLTQGTASGQQSHSTHYIYYDVSGETAGDLYAAMHEGGPDVNGDRAFAATIALPSQSGRLEQGSACRVRDYHYDLAFTIRLPRLSTEDLAPDLAKRWTNFTAFLKRHEETHRSLWIACTKDVESKVSALSAPSCPEVDALAAKVVEDAETACRRAHQAFDAAEQKRLSAYPFMKSILSPAHRSERAMLDARAKKRKSQIRKNFN
jgi:predicted secreted Zn-dependent protease